MFFGYLVGPSYGRGGVQLSCAWFQYLQVRASDKGVGKKRLKESMNKKQKR
jgi:hypothetical protein